MKFKNYLESISGIGIYPLISLIVFFLFFSLLVTWVIKVNKEYISDMKQIPLNDNENGQTEQ